MKWRDYDRMSTVSLSFSDERISDSVEDFRKLSDSVTLDEFLHMLESHEPEIDAEGRFFADDVMILSDGRIIKNFSERVQTSFLLKGDLYLVFDSGHVVNYTSAAESFADAVRIELTVA